MLSTVCEFPHPAEIRNPGRRVEHQFEKFAISFFRSGAISLAGGI